MKTNGYKFGPKNNWRRWAWNRVVERLPSSVEDATVMYLAGEEDLDRKVAIERGFHSANLIAIDKEKKVVDKLRKKGCIVIHAGLREAMISLCSARRIANVLVADFCCGLTDTIEDIINLFICDAGNLFPEDGAVLVFNFMRGRDKGGITDVLSKTGFNGTKHRGEMFIEYFVSQGGVMNDAFTFAAADNRGMASKSERTRVYTEFMQMIDPSFDYEATDSVEVWKKFLRERMDPEFNTYKSGRIRMDSVVMYYRPSFFYGTRVMRAVEDWNNNEGLNRSIKSVMAVQTMRREGTLPPCPLA